MTRKKEIGNLGEKIAAVFLSKKGFEILEKNWEKPKIGELDIIARKENIYYFVEVKTSARWKEDSEYSPLEHMDREKIKKFQRIINHFLIDNNLIDAEYKMSVILVRLNQKTKKAKVEFIEDFY